jgi:hypothetical protein
MRNWFRAFRPLILWAIFVLALYGYRLHQKWIVRTRLHFSVSMEGRPIDGESAAVLDGFKLGSSDRVRLGWRKLSVSHPKGENFTTNLFIWYGPTDLGEIRLKRHYGTLELRSNPTAQRIQIRGPEFSQTLSNSAGTTLRIPSDQYAIEAHYQHWRQSDWAEVAPNRNSLVNLTPRLGVLRLQCNQADSSFTLADSTGRQIDQGKFPGVVADLMMGRYALTSTHHGNEHVRTVSVDAWKTNDVAIEIAYGEARLESEPAGASVLAANGRWLGYTPLLVSELPPGRWSCELRLDGFETVETNLDVSANVTNSYRAKLVNTEYLRAVRYAQRALEEKKYDQAIEASAEALRIVPKDEAVLKIRREAIKSRCLQQVIPLGGRGEYAVAIRELESALLEVPESPELKQLLAENRQYENARLEKLRQETIAREEAAKREAALKAEQVRQEAERRAERLRQEQSSPARKLFDSLMENDHDAGFFETYQLFTRAPLSEVQKTIVPAFAVEPQFVGNLKSSDPDTFVVEVRQSVPGGYRRVVVVGGQTWPNEAQILYKVFEYTSGQTQTALGGMVSITSNLIFTPVHPSKVDRMTDELRAQLRDGVAIVTKRVKNAIGNAP